VAYSERATQKRATYRQSDITKELQIG